MTAVTASVLTSESTSSDTYTDLTTTTDSVTVTVGASGTVLVCVAARMSSSSTFIAPYLSYAVSGANTSAAAATKALTFAVINSYYTASPAGFFLETGLSTGSTTFKMKYRSGSGTATFSNRYITAIPLEDLTTRTAAAAYVSTSESTSSTSYTDLTTTTDTVTVTVGPSGLALVFLLSWHVDANCYTGYDISGATTRSADDDHAVTKGPTNQESLGGCFLETGLAAGSTTFKMKYKVTTGTRTFSERRIAVIPL